ncbi:MAG: HEAT repeat domain-containing protein, partial [Planctomycetota bacterium]
MSAKKTTLLVSLPLFGAAVGIVWLATVGPSSPGQRVESVRRGEEGGETPEEQTTAPAVRGGTKAEDAKRREPGPGLDPPSSTPKEEGGDEKPAPVKPAPSREEVERERLVNEYIVKLADRKASDQTRYAAAVQLGDLKHLDAVQPLIKALQKDSNDLVCRAAAWSLGMFGKDAIPAIPALIGEIGGKQEYVGYMCERALGEITKAVLGKAVTFNFDPTMSQRERRKVQENWEEWWAKNRAQFL